MRRIRTLTPQVVTDGKDDLESITDPALLSHALFDLGARRESTPYPASLRVSGLHDVCVREKVLGFRDKAALTKHTTLALDVTFQIGHSIHEFLQNSGRYFKNRRLGWWKCSACGNVYFGRYPVNSCQQCKAGKESFRYHEHSINLTSPYRVTGHMDNIIELSPGNFVIADFKTISGAGFKGLTGPKGDHCIQVISYMMLTEYCQDLPIRVRQDRGLVVYIAKEHQAKECPFKTFWVHRDDATEGYIRGTLQTFTEAINDGVTVPNPHPDCAGSKFTSYRARNCLYCDYCKAN